MKLQGEIPEFRIQAGAENVSRDKSVKKILANVAPENLFPRILIAWGLVAQR